MKVHIVESKTPLEITVLKSHIDKAVDQNGFCHKEYCVFAEAIKESLIKRGLNPLRVRVGHKRMTTLLDTGRSLKEIRYTTPTKLKNALDKWDNTKGQLNHGEWAFPIGNYTFPPLVESRTAAYQRKRALKRKKLGDKNGLLDRGNKPKKEHHRPAVSARTITFIKDKKAALKAFELATL